MLLKSCLVCGKDLNKGEKFCSQSCNGIYHKDHILKYAFIKGDPHISGKNSHRWKGGKPYCVDCNKQISWRSKRCRSCNGRNIIKNGSYGNGNWKGGRLKTQEGYILLHKPHHPNANKKGYVAEHRFIVSKKIGRPLKEYEHVHHLNGIKDDNRPENLEVLNGDIHFIVTKMEWRIRELEAENRKLKRTRPRCVDYSTSDL